MSRMMQKDEPLKARWMFFFQNKK